MTTPAKKPTGWRRQGFHFAGDSTLRTAENRNVPHQANPLRKCGPGRGPNRKRPS